MIVFGVFRSKHAANDDKMVHASILIEDYIIDHIKYFATE